MEKLQCLVCGKEMEDHHKISYIDYNCTDYKCNDIDYTRNELRKSDHQLSLRIVNDFWMDGSIQMNTPKMIKLRLAFYKERLHLKIHYDQKYSEVWGKVNSSHRVRINQIIVPDFSDLNKLKNKIKTLLVFG